MDNFKNKRILIMGAGVRGKRILRYFRNCGVNVAGFLDNCVEKQGTEVDGVRVYPTDAFCEQEKEVVIIVSPENSEELEKQLSKKYSHVVGEKEADVFSFLPQSAGYKKLFPLGHFYNLYPDVEKLRDRKDIFYETKKLIQGIDFNEEVQVDILKRMTDLYQNIPDWNDNPQYRARYGNVSLSAADMIGLCTMLQIIKPKRMVEVGSGWSSAVSLDTNEFRLGNTVSLSFIEPYPQLLQSILRENDKINLRAQGLEEVEIDFFEKLEDGDILFIDSTHVSKMGSDVNYLFFEILPRLKRGVYVHLHDIFYPFEYPWHWIEEEGMVWNELYLLRAFLQYNHEWEVIFFQNMMEKKHMNIFMKKWPIAMPVEGGSFWMRKK